MSHRIKDIKRFSRVINVLFRHGFGYFIEQSKLKGHIPFSKRLMRHKFKVPDKPEIMLRKAFEELGGAYVKLGQLLSIRPDLVPQEYCNEFRKLQDNVRPFSFSAVKEIISKELKKPISKIFKSFDEKPIGSASIGQVHKAVLKNGKKVVVKVQRPNIKETMLSDISIMRYIADKLEKHYDSKSYSFVEIVNEFERYTKDELNYTKEARNADIFYNNFKRSKTVVTPKVYSDFTTKKVLTLEFMSGTKLQELKSRNLNRKQISTKSVDAMLKMVFEDGVFHADLHPGNIIVSGKKIALFDFGIVGFIAPDIRKKGLRLLIALVNKDTQEITNLLLKVGKPSEQTDIDSFKQKVEEIVNTWYSPRQRVTYMLYKLLNISVENNIKMPVSLILLGKALVTVEGTCLGLDKNFDFVVHTKPYIKKQLGMGITKDLFSNMPMRYRKVQEMLSDVPDGISDVMQKVKQGKLKIDIEDTDVRHLGLEIDRSSNRLSYGIVIAAFVVSGALIMQTTLPPIWFGYPAFSLICFAVAFALCLLLITSIVREGKEQ